MESYLSIPCPREQYEQWKKIQAWLKKERTTEPQRKKKCSFFQLEILASKNMRKKKKVWVGKGGVEKRGGGETIVPVSSVTSPPVRNDIWDIAAGGVCVCMSVCLCACVCVLKAETCQCFHCSHIPLSLQW